MGANNNLTKQEDKEMDKVYWINKSGESIDIDTMDIDHLRNTLKMIVRARLQAASDKLLKKYPLKTSWDNEKFIKDLKGYETE